MTEGPAGAVSGATSHAEKRVAFSCKHRGLLLRDAKSAYLHWDDEDARPLDELHGAASTWRQGDPARTEPQQREAMTWARRLKRVFRIDLEICKHCAPNRTGFLLLLAARAQPLLAPRPPS